MAKERCYWDDWDWEILDPQTPETTGTSTTGSSGNGDVTTCPPEEVCEKFFKPRIDAFLMIPTSIIEIYYET